MKPPTTNQAAKEDIEGRTQGETEAARLREALQAARQDLVGIRAECEGLRQREEQGWRPRALAEAAAAGALARREAEAQWRGEAELALRRLGLCPGW